MVTPICESVIKTVCRWPIIHASDSHFGVTLHRIEI